MAGDKKRYKNGYKPNSISRVEKPRRQKQVVIENRREYKNHSNNGYNRPPKPNRPDRNHRHRGGTRNYNYNYNYNNRYYNDPYFWGSVAGGIVGGLAIGAGAGVVYAEPICETFWIEYYDPYYGYVVKEPRQECR